MSGSRHRVLKPWVEDQRSTHELKETVSTTVFEHGWICSTCTLQNSVREAHCIACSAHKPVNLRGRPLLSPGTTCTDGSSTESGVPDRGTWTRGHGGKVARVAQPAVNENPLAADISGASQGLVVETVVLMGRPISNDELHDRFITECEHRPNRNQKLLSRHRGLLSPSTTCADRFSTTSGVSGHCAQPSGHGGKAARMAQPAVKESPLAAGISSASEGVCVKRKRCEHGRQRNQCKECGGSSICEHRRQRHRCKECGRG